MKQCVISNAVMPASTSLAAAPKKDVDGRVKPGHDGCFFDQALRMRGIKPLMT